jgi:PDZ domain-containing secreted protein
MRALTGFSARIGVFLFTFAAVFILMMLPFFALYGGNDISISNIIENMHKLDEKSGIVMATIISAMLATTAAWLASSIVSVEKTYI